MSERPDFDAFKRELVHHFANLASEPAWKAYVKHECEQMEKAFPYQWSGLTELVRKELEKKQ